MPSLAFRLRSIRNLPFFVALETLVAFCDRTILGMFPQSSKTIWIRFKFKAKN